MAQGGGRGKSHPWPHCYRRVGRRHVFNVHRGCGDSSGGGTMTAPCGTRCSSGECACMCVCVCVCVCTRVPLRNAARAVWFPRQRCEGAQAATRAQRVRKTCHRSPGSQLEPGQLLPTWWSRTWRGWAAVELERGPGPRSIKPPPERAWLGQWGRRKAGSQDKDESSATNAPQ